MGNNSISYAGVGELNGDYAGQDVPAGYGATPSAQPTLKDSGSDNGAVDVAKEQATSVGQGAVAAGQQVAATAKDQAQNVAAEAATQARDLIGQARTELTDQASTQQKRLAEGLRVLGDELHSMAANSDHAGVATDLAHQGAGKVHEVASWLDGREPGNLVQELRGFARQRPLAFLALAAGAGVLAGRLTRGLQAASGDETGSGPASTTSTSNIGTSNIGTSNIGTSEIGAARYSDTTVTRAPVGPSTTPDDLFVSDVRVDSARPFASSQDSASVDGLLGDRL